jgi:hypothetical protein
MELAKTLYFLLNTGHRSVSYIDVYTKKCENDVEVPLEATLFTFKNIQNNVIYICEILDETIEYIDTFKLYSSDCKSDDDSAEIAENDNIKVISKAIIAYDDNDDNDDNDNNDDNDCHSIGNIICQLKYDENFKQNFNANFDKFLLKVQSQIYNDGLFRIALSPEEEDSLQGIIGLPNKVINHMQENCGTYFMLVFDIPVPLDTDDEEDTYILRKELLYPIH